MSNRYLLIGGPKDGEFVETKYDYYVVPLMQESTDLRLIDGSKTTMPVFQQIHYNRVKLVDSCKGYKQNELFVMATGDVIENGVIKTLVEGYGKVNDSQS